MILVLVVVGVAPAILVASVSFGPSFQRTFGRDAVVLGSVAVMWCAAVVAVAWAAPVWLPWMSASGLLAAVPMGASRVRGWFAPGKQPPGPLAFVLGFRALGAQEFYLRSFERHGPIFKMAQFATPTICVLGLERIGRLVRGHASQLGPSPLPFSQSVMGNFLRYMDDETHARYGGAFRRAMAGAPSAVAAAETRRIVQEYLDALAGSGPCSPFAGFRRVARESLSTLLFGYGPNDPAARRFDVLAARFGQASLGQALRRRDRVMLSEMRQALLVQAARLEREGVVGADAPVLSRLAALDLPIADETVLSNLVFMHKIASGNVSALLVWLAYHWATQPAVVDQIRRLPAADRAGALDAFLAETLRLCQSEYIYRTVRTEFEFEGFHFPRGWMVRSCVWESHRTTDGPQAPTEFRLRLEKDAYARAHYVPFGMGRHACNGVDINHTIVVTLLDELATRFDLAVVGAEPFQRSMRHWSHWQPNRGAQLVLGRRP